MLYPSELRGRANEIKLLAIEVGTQSIADRTGAAIPRHEALSSSDPAWGSFRRLASIRMGSPEPSFKATESRSGVTQ